MELGSGGSFQTPRLGESGGNRLDSLHRFAVKELFITSWALVELNFPDGIVLALELTIPVLADLLDIIAAARRTTFDFYHNVGLGLERPL